ncbi:hypothetical protein BD769DRAFT_1037592 [Suillus cothurnatus]|nr:hypothetical protein BD769DRAFT_1037592 [Suillus cothurnatus]
MHRALLSDDILTSILQHVSSPTDLINFASTCSAVSDTPLDKIWRVQSSLTPLIMCLPEDTWEIREDRHIHFTREPLPTEWERVRLNASRIRRFKCSYEPRLTRSPKLDNHVVERLFALFAPIELFPNLHALDFGSVSNRLQRSSDFWLLRQFFSPMLETLCFDVAPGASVHDVELLMGALTTEATGLRQLTIMVQDGSAARHFTLPRSLPKLNQLEIYTVDRCLVMHYLANAQHWRFLQSLSLVLNEESGNFAPIDMPLELGALKSLTLYGDRLPQCTSFLPQIVTPRLAWLDVQFCTPASPEEVNTFMLSLETCCQTFANLEHIRVSCDICPRPDSQSLPSNIFRPLLKFTRLNYVVFDIGFYCLDDAFLKDAAVAWPGIRVLAFIAESQTDISAVTFTAALSFATRCTSLETLHLHFDATQVPGLPYVPGGDTDLWLNQTALRELHVGHSHVETATLVPFLLAFVFPNLGDIQCHQTFGIPVSHPVRENEFLWGKLVRQWRKVVDLRKTNPAKLASFRPVLLQYMLGQVVLAGEARNREEGILEYMLNGMDHGNDGMGDDDNSMSTALL